MDDAFRDLRSLCKYLEMLNSELEMNIRRTQSDVSKMQDIYEAIRPFQIETEPKENEEIARLISQAKGEEFKAKAAKTQALEPFEEFQQCLKQFNEIPALKRDQFSRKFINGVAEFTQKTPAHLFDRLVPCVKRLNAEFDKVLKADMDQPAAAFRATYATERAEAVADAFENEVAEFESIEEIDVPINERKEKPKDEENHVKPISSHLETVANFSQKQLSTLYRLRGDAREALIMSRIREKTEEVVLPILTARSLTRRETLMKIASRAFAILSIDPRSYAVVSDQ